MRLHWSTSRLRVDSYLNCEVPSPEHMLLHSGSGRWCQVEGGMCLCIHNAVTVHRQVGMGVSAHNGASLALGKGFTELH